MPGWVWAGLVFVVLIGVGVAAERWRARRDRKAVAEFAAVKETWPPLFAGGELWVPTVRAVPSDYPLWDWPEKKAEVTR